MTDKAAELAAYLAQPEVTLTVLADGSGVILDIAASQVITLNDTGVLLAEALRDGVASSEELVDQLTTSYEVDQADARADVGDFLDLLAGHLLIARGEAAQ